MRMGKDKIRYNVTHGIAEFFSERLLADTMKAHFYVIVFDESLNKVSQK